MNCFKNIVAIIILCTISSMSPMAIHSPTQNKQSNTNTPERPLSSAPSSKPKRTTVQSKDMEPTTTSSSTQPPQRPSSAAPSTHHPIDATVHPNDMEPTTTSSSTSEYNTPPQRPLPELPSPQRPINTTSQSDKNNHGLKASEFVTQDESMY